MSNWLLALIRPMWPGFEMWWLLPSSVTVPSGAANVTVFFFAAAFTASTSNEPAASTSALYRYSEM